jgi:hypothetical protein
VDSVVRRQREALRRSGNGQKGMRLGRRLDMEVEQEDVDERPSAEWSLWDSEGSGRSMRIAPDLERICPRHSMWLDE